LAIPKITLIWVKVFILDCKQNCGNCPFVEKRMNLSGIAVTTHPEWVEQVANALSEIEGMEVFQTDIASGKLVVVQEAASVGAEVEGFNRIRALPHVMAVDLVQHYFEHDNESIDAIPDELNGLEGIHVPAELQD
jgi:nitrate reductase NapAB chaperone NapD